MGLFIPLFIGEDAIRKMVEAGIELLEQTEAVGLRVYEAVRDRFPAPEPVELELKGKSAPVATQLIEVARRS